MASGSTGLGIFIPALVFVLLVIAPCHYLTAQSASDPAPTLRAEAAPATDAIDDPAIDDRLPEGPLLTRGTVIGGLLIVLVTAAGLTLTFRSLLLERRNRRRRMRPRGQREPRGSDE